MNRTLKLCNLVQRRDLTVCFRLPETGPPHYYPLLRQPTSKLNQVPNTATTPINANPTAPRTKPWFTDRRTNADSSSHRSRHTKPRSQQG
ncbi:hypothetical protein KC19_12G056900, partial [Ceratodon purpureus]